VYLVELFEGGLEGIAIFAGGLVKIFAEAVGGVVHELFGVFEALGVTAEVHVDELGVGVDLLEGGAGLVDVTVQHLLACHFGHDVDELSVEEALVTGARLLGFELELEEALRVWKIFISRGGASRYGGKEEQRQKEKSGGMTYQSHTHLEGSACLLHVLEGEEAVAGLPLLIRKLAVCHGEELFIQVGRLFGVVQLVVRSCRKEQR